VSLLELRRLFSEWNIRLKRVQEVLQPESWVEEDWNQFSKTLSLVTQKYGKTWEENGTTYYDLRWTLRDGGELACQFDETPGERRALVVAQHGGFADGTENYIWFFCEFNEHGEFIGDPYWVDGNWKDALAMMFMPQKMPSQFYLQDVNAPMQNNLLQQSSETADPYLQHQPESEWRQAEAVAV